MIQLTKTFVHDVIHKVCRMLDVRMPPYVILTALSDRELLALQGAGFMRLSEWARAAGAWVFLVGVLSLLLLLCGTATTAMFLYTAKIPWLLCGASSYFLYQYLVQLRALQVAIFFFPPLLNYRLRKYRERLLKAAQSD